MGIKGGIVRIFRLIIVLVFGLGLAGCAAQRTNNGELGLYRTPSLEAEWIRNGEPIEYLGQLWFPMDEVENLLDSEVYLLGEYRGVQFFAEKKDVKPYDRLYTKFGHDRYRAFEPKDKKDK